MQKEKNLESKNKAKKFQGASFTKLTIEGNQTSTTSTNKVSQSGGAYQTQI